jgi:Mrp family chromosome partitioning ATPase
MAEVRMGTAEGDAWGGGPGLVESLWRYRLLIAVVTILAALAGLGYSLQQPTRYRAVSTLILRDPNDPGVLGAATRVRDLAPYVTKQAELVTSTPVRDRASQILQGQGQQRAPVIRRGAIDVRSSPDLRITISATEEDPKFATAIANAVADAYQQIAIERVNADAQQAIAKLEEARTRLQEELNASVATTPRNPQNPLQLTAQQEALVAQLATLRARIDDIAVRAALDGSRVELFEAASEPSTPASPNPVRDAALAAVLGALAAGAYAWRAAAQNQRADDREDPVSVLQAPLLGEVPEFHAPPLIAGAPIPSPAMLGPVVAEAYRFAIASLDHMVSNLSGSSLVVTSVAPGDGKTSTALNLAISAFRDQRRVVLVDADERRRHLSRICGRSGSLGLTDLGDDNIPVERCLHDLKLADGGSVPFVPSGSELEQSTMFVRTPAFRKALLRIAEQADLVLLDTPSLLAVSDTVAIAGQADGVIFVVNRGTPLRQLRTARERLSAAGSPLIGYIFNRSSASLSPYIPKYNHSVGEPFLDSNARAGPRAWVGLMGRYRKLAADL